MMKVRLIQDGRDHQSDKKPQLLRTLRRLVADTCRMRNEGASYAKLAHSQGYADGYMQLLIDAGFVTQQEVLDLVVEVRRGVSGPATRTLPVEPALSA